MIDAEEILHFLFFKMWVWAGFILSSLVCFPLPPSGNVDLKEGAQGDIFNDSHTHKIETLLTWKSWVCPRLHKPRSSTLVVGLCR